MSAPCSCLANIQPAPNTLVPPLSSVVRPPPPSQDTESDLSCACRAPPRPPPPVPTLTYSSFSSSVAEPTVLLRAQLVAQEKKKNTLGPFLVLTLQMTKHLHERCRCRGRLCRLPAGATPAAFCPRHLPSPPIPPAKARGLPSVPQSNSVPRHTTPANPAASQGAPAVQGPPELVLPDCVTSTKHVGEHVQGK